MMPVIVLTLTSSFTSCNTRPQTDESSGCDPQRRLEAERGKGRKLLHQSSWFPRFYDHEDVSVSAKFCCLTAERLKSDNGTRVTAIDHDQHGNFDQTVEALNDLTPSKRKLYIAQFTIWDGKSKTGSARIVDFRPGAVYEFRQIDGVGFYADIPMGRLQFEVGSGNISEMLPPMLKRKASQGLGKKKAKVPEPELSESTEDEDDVLMDSESKMEEHNVGPRTRSGGVATA
ncbi:hypothetical protein V7S43_017178 [Phytophthora oleae]|uniref:Uncharacterized protein n=1 Tax=Phytophthora oleae TaxID=2107226 RepID=A0ABD3EUE5_9STRA